MESIKDIKIEERQATMLEGALLMCSLKLSECTKFFEEIKDHHPHYLLMHVLAIYSNTTQNKSGDKGADDELCKYINKLLQKAGTNCHLQINAMDDVLSSFNKKKPSALEMQHLAACQLVAFTLLIKASVQIRQQSYIKAGVSFRKSWKFYEECYKIILETGANNVDQEYYYDVVFGVGLFNFVVSLVPPAFSFFVEAMGFKGDRQKGFELLKRCSQRQTFTGLLASSILQLLYQFYIEDNQQAMSFLEDMLKRFPGIVTPLFTGGYTLRFMGRVEESDSYFKTIMEASEQMKQAKLSCLYELGTSAVKRSDWETAIQNINCYLNEDPKEGYRCYAAYEAGVCYFFLKDYENSVKNFRKSVEWVRKEYTFDVYAARKSKQYLENSKNYQDMIHPFELIYFEAKERIKVSQYEDSLKLLLKAKQFKIKTLCPDHRGLYNLLYGENLRKMGNFMKSKKKLEKVLKEKVKFETLVIPHALVELAQIAMAENKLEQAKTYLKNAKEYKGYDFYSQLLRTITRLTDTMNGVNY